MDNRSSIVQHIEFIRLWVIYFSTFNIGLFLSLRGTPIDGDGFVDVDDIGSSDNPDNRLLCHTNDTNCCSSLDPGPAQGVWLLPNGAAPRTFHDLRDDTGYGRDRGTSVVRLYRQNNPPERGRFSCELLGDTIYVNICEQHQLSESTIPSLSDFTFSSA